jgi:hypothetical protein
MFNLCDLRTTECVSQCASSDPVTISKDRFTQPSARDSAPFRFSGDDPMQIFVRSVTEIFLAVDIEAYRTVLMLKEKIFERDGTPAREQVLIARLELNSLRFLNSRIKPSETWNSGIRIQWLS